MGNPPVLAVLHHKLQEQARSFPMIRVMIPKWKAAGFEVKELFGTDRFVPADAVFVHVDLSVVPKDYLEFAHRYPLVINGKIADIRKRLYSEIQVSRDDGYQGPVVVKTSFNFGGGPEAVLRGQSRGIEFVRRAYRWLARQRKNSPYRIRGREDYRVHPSIKDVPDEILNSRELVIEKYLPERDGDKNRLRYYYFFGDVEVSGSKLSGDPLCLVGTQSVDQHEIPGKIREVRKRMGLDYGKIDYAIHEGEPVFFDVNKTQGVLVGGPSDFQREVAERLADGIFTFFPEMRPSHAAPR